MPATQKISVAMGVSELRLAKTAAEHEGLSLSAFVTQAVRERLEERERVEAARVVLAGFLPREIPTAEETRGLVAFWNRQEVAPATHARRRKPRRK